VSPVAHQRRAASVYLLVLATSLLVCLIALSAVTGMRIQQRISGSADDVLQARLYAQSAIELGLLWTVQDPDWRQHLPNGTWVQGLAVGRGTVNLEGVDPNDGDLADSETDPVVLTAEGIQGQASQKLEVTLQAHRPPVGALEVALHVGDDLVFSSAYVQCDQTISANGNVAAASSLIYSDVEAVGAVLGWQYLGATSQGVMPRTMPDETVFDYYLNNGTSININALPANGDTREIRSVLLSPASNPFGFQTNDEGIYVIDCQGQDISIRDSRIVGTLVLVDPGSSSAVEGAVLWQPAVVNYPVLLVDGSMTLRITTDPLVEWVQGTNFNPPRTPYEGSEDSDYMDTYPSVIQGLVYIGGEAATDNHVTIEGVMIAAEALNATGTLELTYQDTYYQNPPPGFLGPVMMRVAWGSYQQVTD